QFRRVPANVRGIVGGPADIDAHIVANGPAQLRQRLQERAVPGLKIDIIRGSRQQHANAAYALALLRTRRKGPSRYGTTKNTEKFPPPHVRPQLGDDIVSARTSTLIGAATGF